ncbi:MAG: hypothetical protein JSV33_07650 [bacterium]|nr:MAG: hypothetical protein JSV33_07650 [bacterium]
MGFLHYLGILFLSSSWFWMLQIYRPPGSAWLPLLIVGLVLLSFPPRPIRLVTGYLHPEGISTQGLGAGGPSSTPAGWARRFPAVSVVLLLPLLLALFLLPRYFAPGLIVLILSVLVGIVQGEGAGRFRPVTGCLLGGSILLIQGVLLPILAVVSAHIHTVPLFGYILYPFVRLFDPGAALDSGRIFVSSVEDIYGYGVSFEKLAFLPLALFFIGVGLSRLFARDLSRSLWRMLLAFIIFAAVRFLFLLFIIVMTGADWLFWRPKAITLSLIFFPVILAWVLPYRREAHPEATAGARGTRAGLPIGAAALVTLAVFFIVGSLTFHDPGRMKAGRVLFDEKYSDWEWSDRKYDREWYGSKSGYNYYSLAEYIDYFYDLDRGNKPFTREYLAGYDVVVIKTPTTPFTREEIEIIEDYVRNGGGLFLIGDHTNVFGTSTNLNPLAARFGLRFNYDSTYQLHNMSLSYFMPPPLVAHPSILHMPEFFFATSCSMDAPIFGEHAKIGYGLRTIMLDYSRKSYFPDKGENEYEFGFVLQMAGAKAGKGRVLGHTDSTVFSNFFMFIPGKPEVFLGALDWLNRTNRWHRLNIILFAAGVLVAICAVRSLRNSGALKAYGAVLFGLLVGLLIAVHLFDAMKRRAYPKLVPRREIPTIAFDRDPSRFDMPLTSLVRRRERSLHTFYVWTQRLDMVPSLHPTMQDALAASPIAVVANPSRPLSIEEVDVVVDYLRSGGNMLLIVDPTNRGTGAHDFLGIFRMGLQQAAEDTISILNRKGQRICTAINAASVRGGIPLLTLPGGRVVFAYEKLGSGRFFVFTDFHIFSQAVMGPTSIVPNRGQREVFELEYQILEILRGEREPEEIEPFKVPVLQTPGVKPGN